MTERIPNLITKAEAAARLDVNIRTIDRYLASNTLTALKYHNGRVRIDAKQVAALLTPAVSPATPRPGGTAGFSSSRAGSAAR